VELLPVQVRSFEKENLFSLKTSTANPFEHKNRLVHHSSGCFLLRFNQIFRFSGFQPLGRAGPATQAAGGQLQPWWD
jgi:hypothetical protein